MILAPLSAHTPLPIEVVAGQDWRLSDELVRFWTTEGVCGEAAARARVPEAACVLRDHDGSIAGVSTASPHPLPFLGGRLFWVYGLHLRRRDPGALDAMLAATWRALAARFDPAARGPLGLCLLLDDPAERQRRPEAVWADPPLVYGGYLDDGRQIRVGYFDGARIDG